MIKVLAALDNSAAARPVLGMAMALGRLLGAEVEAVNVTEDGVGTAEACAQRMGVPFSIISGDPAEQLAALAADDDVVALAVGARSRPIGRRPVGHLALTLADMVDKPLLLVPPDTDPPDRLHRVLIAMEGRPEKARTARRAMQLATAAGLELVVVHVDDETTIPSFSDQVAHETLAYADEFMSRYCSGAPEARLELRVGVPANEVIAIIESEQPDMIIIGWRQDSDPNRGLTGREIVNRSPVPVLLVAVTVESGPVPDPVLPAP
jgi:nucleotide-binding universal stress UspA family protein